MALGPRRTETYELLQGVSRDALGVVAAEMEVPVDDVERKPKVELHL